MGISPFKVSSSIYDAPLVSGNPDPKQFKITSYSQVGSNLVVLINYPDCTNYEGDKILVLRDTPISEVVSALILDPHFTEKDVLKPFARFEPTEYGYQKACELAKLL